LGKTETVEEFLARGGVITKLPMVEEQYKSPVVKSNTVMGVDGVMTLPEGAFYYAEKRKKKKKKPDPEKLKELLNDLPDNLRNELSNELAEKEEAKTDG
jgi:hypothetical protein